MRRRGTVRSHERAVEARAPAGPRRAMCGRRSPAQPVEATESAEPYANGGSHRAARGRGGDGALRGCDVDSAESRAASGGARGRRSRDGRSPAALVEATMPAGRGGDRCTEFPCRAGRGDQRPKLGALAAAPERSEPRGASGGGGSRVCWQSRRRSTPARALHGAWSSSLTWLWVPS